MIYLKQGRPRIEIDKDQFVKLCELQATVREVAGFFHCGETALREWCKRELGMTFEEAFEEHRVGGLLSLRRNQFQLAEKNAAVAIWLGKQHLGQKDIITYNNLDDTEDDPLTASIKASFVDKEKDE